MGVHIFPTVRYVGVPKKPCSWRHTIKQIWCIPFQTISSYLLLIYNNLGEREKTFIRGWYCLMRNSWLQIGFLKLHDHDHNGCNDMILEMVYKDEVHNQYVQHYLYQWVTQFSKTKVIEMHPFVLAMRLLDLCRNTMTWNFNGLQSW